jgi:hypothetical protein
VTHTRLEDHDNSQNMFILTISTDMNVFIIVNSDLRKFKRSHVRYKLLLQKKKFGNTLTGYELRSLLFGRVCPCTDQVFRIVFSSYPSNSISIEPGMDCTLTVVVT